MTHPHTVSYGAVRALVLKAIRVGSATEGNRKAVVTGNLHIVDSFVGRVVIPNGRIDVYYYNTAILSFDFERRRSTDHGMYGFRKSNDETLATFLRVFKELFKLPTMVGSTFYWSRVFRKDADGIRFIQGAPWIKNGWFYWDRNDGAAVEGFFRSRECVRSPWFVYDWDANGKWSQRFVDADAERRYNNYLKRGKRCRLTVTPTKRPSSKKSKLAATKTKSKRPSKNSTTSETLHGTEARVSPNG